MRCRCKKQDGLQCNREANENSMFCWQHQIYCPLGLIPKSATLTVSHDDPLMNSYKSVISKKSNSSAQSQKLTSISISNTPQIKSTQGTPTIISQQLVQKMEPFNQSKQSGQKQQGSESRLSEGGYGCVYSPPLPCIEGSYLTSKDSSMVSNADYIDGVMKVMDKPSARSELSISQSIRKIDKYNDWFLPLSGDLCQIPPQISQLAKCKLYQSSTDQDQADYRGYFMKNGGQTYAVYIYHHDPPIGLIWTHLKHLLAGLEILMLAKIVHMDIKLNNIMIRPEKMPVFIDFGISFFADENNTHLLRHLQFDPNYPLFYSAVNTKDVTNLYDEYEFLVSLFQADYKKGTAHDLIKTLSDQARNRHEYINKVVWPNRFKIDLYMLMQTFNEILNSNRPVYEAQDPIITEAMTQLIQYCLNPDPFAQYDIEQTLNFVKSIP